MIVCKVTENIYHPQKNIIELDIQLKATSRTKLDAACQ